MTDFNPLRLRFDPRLNALGESKRLSYGLSAAVEIGNTLWVANDEAVSLERLTRTDGGYGDHRRFDLKDFISLPVDPNSEKNAEIDVEGLDYRDGFIWLVGSHSLKRAQPRSGESAEAGIERLAKLRADGNRYLLARIPVEQWEGLPILARTADRDDELICAGQLKGDERGNDLTELLEDDEHLGPFLTIPGKDNGFDIEGLTVAPGGRVFLGLRGPVLRGWAAILELRIEPDGDEPARLRLLKPDPDQSKLRYRKHFLDLGGLGIRELCLIGDDLLIMAGPTLDMDGPAALFRWIGGARAKGPELVSGDRLVRIRNLPAGEGCDRPEGLALLDADSAGPSLLVVYDATGPARRPSEHDLLADRLDLPETEISR